MSTNPSPAEALQWDLVDRLHKSLRVSGLDAQTMASRLGVHRNTVAPWLKGTRVPSHRTLAAWAMACGPAVTVEWLERGTAPGPDGPGAADEYAPWDSNPEPADYKIVPLTRRFPRTLPTFEPDALPLSA